MVMEYSLRGAGRRAYGCQSMQTHSERTKSYPLMTILTTHQRPLNKYEIALWKRQGETEAVLAANAYVSNISMPRLLLNSIDMESKLVQASRLINAHLQ
jgi:hypothetical protein